VQQRVGHQQVGPETEERHHLADPPARDHQRGGLHSGQQRPPGVDEQHLLAGASCLVPPADPASDRQRQQHARG
jgi:hypothetical protein